MTSWDFVTVDVFTNQQFAGNPLAVFPNAAGLTSGLMQKIAREFNLSETTFVFPPKDPSHTASVLIFTPQAELPFAGHPNIGAAWVLASLRPELGRELVFEETAGLVPVRILTSAQGCLEGAMLTAPQPLYVRDLIDPDRLGSRMFAPSLGVVEDPATGSANAALAAFLVSLDPECHHRSFQITQGIEMGRPSELLASAERREDGKIWAQIGGNCVPMMRGSISLSDI